MAFLRVAFFLALRRAGLRFAFFLALRLAFFLAFFLVLRFAFLRVAFFLALRFAFFLAFLRRGAFRLAFFRETHADPTRAPLVRQFS